MSKEYHSLYPIRIAARKSGLTGHVIRIWERRYQAVEPIRTDSGHRLYNDDHIRRLTALHQLTEHGFRISHIAPLTTEELEKKVSELAVPAPQPTFKPKSPTSNPTRLLDVAITAVKQLDASSLDKLLRHASTQMGQKDLMEQIIAPLLQAIGDHWHNGVFDVSHEHVASMVIRTFLLQLNEGYELLQEEAPLIVTATPPGNQHELGAIMATIAARSFGWNALFGGADLPIPSMAKLVREKNAAAIGISLTYVDENFDTDHYCQQLRRVIPEKVAIIIGGQHTQRDSDYTAVNTYRSPSLEPYQKILTSLEYRN